MALETQIEEALNAGAGSFISPRNLLPHGQVVHLDKLTYVETRLAELRSRFKNNDPILQKLERERSALVTYINEQTILLLKGNSLWPRPAFRRSIVLGKWSAVTVN